jgi:hypothetical protein
MKRETAGRLNGIWNKNISGLTFFISVIFVIFLLVSVQHFLNAKVQETTGDSIEEGDLTEKKI